MVTAWLLPLVLLSPTPKEALTELRKNYESLKTFEMRIVHHNSSGLFPGDYEQKLTWKAPKEFKLKVTKAAKGEERTAPDYICDGINVVDTGGSHPNHSEPINTDLNRMPGWEVSGGQILGWLMKSPSSQLMENPPAQFKVAFTWGDAKEWKGTPVKEIIAKIDGVSESMNLFLSTDGKRLLGWTSTFNKKDASVQYLDQKLNGVLAK